MTCLSTRASKESFRSAVGLFKLIPAARATARTFALSLRDAAAIALPFLLPVFTSWKNMISNPTLATTA